jgi:hypothetical protein
MIKNKLSDIVANQLPEHITEEYPTFVEFLQAYYKYLETQQVYRNIETIRDVETTLDSFVDLLKREFAVEYPEFAKDRFFLKNTGHVSVAHGSEQSYKFLFRQMFKKEVDIRYPKDQILSISNSLWVQDFSFFIKVSAGDVTLLENNIIYIDTLVNGIKTKNKVNVKRVEVVEFASSNDIYEVFISKDYYGSILVGDTISYKGLVATVVPTTFTIKIVNPGYGFSKGQIFSVEAGTGVGLSFKITDVTLIGGIKSCQIITYGIGYTTKFTFDLPSNVIFGNTVEIDGFTISAKSNQQRLSDSGIITKQDYYNSSYSNDYVGAVVADFSSISVPEAISANTAKLQVTLGAVAKYQGYYSNSTGLVSSPDSIIQDSYYYQDYSYVLRIDEALSTYRDTVLSLLHPTGRQMFAEYIIDNFYELEYSIIEPVFKILLPLYSGVPSLVTMLDRLSYALQQIQKSEQIILDETAFSLSRPIGSEITIDDLDYSWLFAAPKASSATPTDVSRFLFDAAKASSATPTDALVYSLGQVQNSSATPTSTARFLFATPKASSISTPTDVSRFLFNAAKASSATPTDVSRFLFNAAKASSATPTSASSLLFSTSKASSAGPTDLVLLTVGLLKSSSATVTDNDTLLFDAPKASSATVTDNDTLLFDAPKASSVTPTDSSSYLLGKAQTSTLSTPTDSIPLTIGKSLGITSVIRNLFTYTEQFDNSAWNKPNGTTVSANVITAPNGSVTADLIIESTSANSKELNRVFTPVLDTKYTFSAYVKAKERVRVRLNIDSTGFGTENQYAHFDVSTGTIVATFGGATATIESVGDGWYRCSVTTINSTSASATLGRITLVVGGTSGYTGDGTSGIYVWGAQLEAGSYATPYQGVAAAGVLVEPAVVRNVLRYTEQLENAYWNKIGVYVQTNLFPYSETFTGWGNGPNTTLVSSTNISPIGEYNAISFTGNGSSSNEYVTKSTALAANTTYTTSIWAKLISGTAPTNTGNAGIISQEYNNGSSSVRATVAFSNLTTSWQRFQVTFTNVVAGTRPTYFIADQNNTAEIAIWGAQLVQGTAAAEYQETYGDIPGYLAPDGSLTADKITDDTGTGIEHYIESANIPLYTNQTYTQSVYVKAADTSTFVIRPVHVGASTPTSEVNFSISSGVISAGSYNGLISSVYALSVGNGWYRCFVTYTLDGTTNSHKLRIHTKASSIYTGDGTSGIYIWGAQLEVGSYATTYQRVGETAGSVDSLAIPIDASSYLLGKANSSTLSTPTDTTRYTLGQVKSSSVTATDASSFLFAMPEASAISTPTDLVLVSLGLLKSSSATVTDSDTLLFATPKSSSISTPTDSNLLSIGKSLGLTSTIRNLYDYTEQLDNSYWGKTNLTVTTANDIVAPDGNKTADLLTSVSSLGAYLSGPISVVSGQTYTISMYAKAGTLSTCAILTYGTTFNNGSAANPSGSFNLSAGTTTYQNNAVGSTINAVGNGWFRCTVTVTATTTTITYPQIARVEPNPSGTLYVWGVQAEVGFYATPYQGVAASGVLVEAAAVRNLLRYTEQFDNATWGKNNSTITANATAAPDGSSTADLLIESATTEQHLITQTYAVTSGATYSYSVYAKAAGWTTVQLQMGTAGPRGVFNLTAGTASVSGALSASIVDVGNGWFRCIMSAVSNGNISMYIYESSSSYAGDGTSGIYLWGAQLEVGSVTTYQRIGENSTATDSLVVPTDASSYLIGNVQASTLSTPSDTTRYTLGQVQSSTLSTPTVTTRYTLGQVQASALSTPTVTTRYTLGQVQASALSTPTDSIPLTVTKLVGLTSTIRNLLTYTENFTANWDKNNSFIQTNQIPNNTMQGAAVGTRPTGWDSNWTSTSNGIVSSIVGVGVESGIEYIDWNITGTYTGTTGTARAVLTTGSSIINAVQGQVWTSSMYISLVSGSLTNVTLNLRLGNYNSSGVGITTASGSNIIPTVSSLSAQRQQFTWDNISDATTAYIGQQLRVALVNGASYNLTVRVGLPQLVQGTSAGDVVKTYGTAQTVQYSAPNGAVTADKLVETSATGQHVCQQTFTPTAGETYTLSWFVKAAERTFALVGFSGGGAGDCLVGVNLSSGTVVSTQGTPTATSINLIGNGWYRISITKTLPTAVVCGLRVTHSTDGIINNQSYTGDGTSGIYIWGAQLDVGSQPTVYQGVAAPGVLVEAAAVRNLLRYTEQADNAYWFKNRSTITADVTTAPDGSLTADKFVENADIAQFHAFASPGNANIPTTAGVTYTGSMYVKAAERTECLIGFGINTGYSTYEYGKYNLSTGVASIYLGSPTVSMVSVGNGWYRCSITVTATTTSTAGNTFNFQTLNASGNNIYNGDGTSGIYIWGAQLEVGSVTTYQRIGENSTATDSLVVPTDASSYLLGKANSSSATPTDTTRYTLGQVQTSSATPTDAPRYTLGQVQTSALSTPTDSNTIDTLRPLGYFDSNDVRRNVFKYTEQFDQSYWNKDNVTVTSNTIAAPNGTTTTEKLVEDSGATASKGFFRGALTVVAGTAYTASIYVKAAERTQFRLTGVTGYFTGSSNANFDLTAGTVLSYSGGFTGATITAVGGGWYRCSGTFVPTVSGSTFIMYHTILSGGINSYTGDGTSGIYVWGAQLEKGSLSAYQAIENDSVVSANTVRNLLSYSDQFDVATSWADAGIDIIANSTTSPEGTLRGATIAATADGLTIPRYITQQVNTTVQGTYTYSVYVKVGTITSNGINIRIRDTASTNSVRAAFNLFTLAVPTGVVTGSWEALRTRFDSVGNSWYRVSITFATNTSYSSLRCETYLSAYASIPDTTGTIFIWGSQLELLETPTVYQPTLDVGTALNSATVRNKLVYTEQFDNAAWKTNAPSGIDGDYIQTNFVRNNTMFGASVGTPGTMPTYWSASNIVNGIARDVSSIGVEDGIEYIDIRVYGTATATGNHAFTSESGTQVPALAGQIWTGSAYVKLVGGSLANVVITNRTNGRDSGGVLLESVGTLTLTPTSAALGTQRAISTGTFTNASIAYATQQVVIAYTSGAVVDVTLRIGLPQLTLGNSHGEPVKTYGTALPVVYTAPDGSMTAQRLSETTGTAQHLFYQRYVTTASTIYSYSVYAKDNGWGTVGLQIGSSSMTARATFNFTSKVATVIYAGYGLYAYMQDVGNGWYRCVVIGYGPPDPNASQADFILLFKNAANYAGDGTSGVYIWGAQLEVGSQASTYQKITAANLTEDLILPADNLNILTSRPVASSLTTPTDAQLLSTNKGISSTINNVDSGNLYFNRYNASYDYFADITYLQATQTF